MPTFLVFALAVLVLAGSAAPVRAISCSEQHRKCTTACDRAAAQGKRCDSARCGGLKSACLDSGCWKGPKFKACGLTRS